MNTRLSALESLPALMNTLSTIDELAFPSAIQPEVMEDTASDHALLEATRTGDQDAFAELVSRYRNQITSYIYRMTNDYDGAVDLAQETFVRVYRAADRYQRTYAFSTYIYRIATNLAISELRKRKRRKLVSLTGFFQSGDGAEARELNPPDERPLQDSELVETERRNAVQRAICTLPEKKNSSSRLLCPSGWRKFSIISGVTPPRDQIRALSASMSIRVLPSALRTLMMTPPVKTDACSPVGSCSLLS